MRPRSGDRGVARIDFLFDNAEQRLYFNEINTIPGSLSFYLWEATGVPFDDLVTKLIAVAEEQHRQKSGTRFTFDANLLQG